MLQRKLLSLVVLVLCLSVTHGALAVEVFPVNADRRALEAIYIANGGEHWTSSDRWMTDRPLYEWQGVSVRRGRVVGLDLADNGLVGIIPEEIGLLTALESLDLRWNDLVGNIPSSIGNLKNIESVLLSGNQLSGVIPWQLGALSNLVRIDLSYNELTGSIPSELGNLANLQSLGLHNNGLIGPIPWQIGKASKLKRLILSQNSLTGWVPPEIGRLRKLTHLNLSMNEMSGPVTQLVHEAPALELLDLRGSGMTVPDLREVPGFESVIRYNLGKPTHTRRMQEQNERVDNAVSGAELLGVTTLLIDNENARKFITDVMQAIQVQDGFLQVVDDDLPAEVDGDQVERAAATINARLNEAGRRIESLDDLERALEVYGNGQIRVPSPAPINSVRIATNGGNNNIAASFLGQSIENTQGYRTSRNVVAPRIVVRCIKLNAQRPHESTFQPGVIKAKFDGDCIDQDPSQTITGTVNQNLFRLEFHWFFSNEVSVDVVGADVHVRTSPPELLRWNPNTSFVSAVCRDGYYFQVVTMSWTGSTSGTIPWFFPPATFLPAYSFGTSAYWIQCR